MATIELATGSARQGDALDVLLGEMLDLQHDLADVVVWLAETWPDDLPALRLYGRGGGGAPTAGLELSGYCTDLDQLDRAAHLLGVPPVDGQVDELGNRYRNARRAFGRVTIRAYTALPHTDTAPEPAP
jgi:hypothetical protein